MEPTYDGTTASAGFETEPFRLRSYQAEMVEASLAANIIVAMDTGSGKTHIALARTAAELELCEPNQLVWFLAPTVALCQQQFKMFKSNLPGYGIQVLTGNDNVDSWTDQSTWDAILNNVRVVLSTPRVLLDALSHGFVQMRQLALLIFDEAHNCTAKHPANQIFTYFYTPVVYNGDKSKLPKILGLSASPVMKAKASVIALREIEDNMHATAKTPKLNRSEMLRFVHRPQLLRIDYSPVVSSPSPWFAFLTAELRNYDMMRDPYIVSLLAQQQRGHDTSRQLQKAFMNNNTYCFQQLKTLVARSNAMMEELGPSVTDWYIQRCVSLFEQMVQTSDQQLLEWSFEEKRHLLQILRRMPVPQGSESSPISLKGISPKVEALIEVLEAEASPHFTGLIFVEQRVCVAALAEVLAVHPAIGSSSKIGTFVGTSQSSKKKANVASLPEPRNQQDTLDKFREGQTNLILATSVLEEGIDVSSCHLVICFEHPKNLKSFIQRRGRARKQESKYFIFYPQYGNFRAPSTWESLEEEMKKAYLDDLRRVKEAENKELIEESSERSYKVPSTGALLTLDNASQHLHHFCALLGGGTQADSRPQFEFEDLESGKITAEVTLPLSVDPAVRKARSLESWITERMARKDAAFEAYKALHQAGLVNDNLLPFREEITEQVDDMQISSHIASLVEVSPTLNPWLGVAAHQQQSPRSYHRYLLNLDRPGEETSSSLILLTPTRMPLVSEVPLYWNRTKRFSVKCSTLPSVTVGENEAHTMRQVTRRILLSVNQRHMVDERYDFVWFLVPTETSDFSVKSEPQTAYELIQQGQHDVSRWGLVSLAGDPRKYVPQSIKYHAHEPLLSMTRVPKRRDFLHPISKDGHEKDAYSRIDEFPASECVVEALPAVYSIFALLIPSVMHRYEVYMVADTLRSTLLAPVAFGPEHVPLILQAITSSATGEESDYQRLEFFGDCILKLSASVHIMAENLLWPESHLSRKKGKIVSNGYAAQAALSVGLDKFIISKRFTGTKWTPPHSTELLDQQFAQNKRTLSSKVLADVVESLIGASYVTGGFPLASTCIRTLLPDEPWIPIPQATATLFAAAPSDTRIHTFPVLEKLIGYNFTKKMLLLDALTHVSYTGPLANCSYERLEFLGDAVLDYLISRRLFAHAPPLAHQQMHAVRTAMANGPFLTFRMFETTVVEQVVSPASLRAEDQHRCLWQYLRLSAPALGAAREAAVAQHETVRERVLEALGQEGRFPWHLLALTDPPKFLSDIVESVIGAIYVDSGGDFARCEAFIGRLGILDCLERILRDGVDCLHPKERLGHLAVEKEVQYEGVGVGGGEGEVGERGAGGKRMYSVQVRVGGEKVGGVVQGLKRLNAETVAAWKAVRIMEGMDDVETESGEEWFDADDGGGIALGGQVRLE